MSVTINSTGFTFVDERSFMETLAHTAGLWGWQVAQAHMNETRRRHDDLDGRLAAMKSANDWPAVNLTAALKAQREAPSRRLVRNNMQLAGQRGVPVYGSDSAEVR